MELQNAAAHTKEVGVHIYREWKHYSGLGKIFMEHIVEAHGVTQKERNLQRPVGDMEHACLRTGACGRHGTCLPTYSGLWETWNMLAYVQGPGINIWKNVKHCYNLTI